MDTTNEFYPFTVHPVADWFPLIEGAAFDTFAEDINQTCLSDKIVVAPREDGSYWLIDGRNRWRAMVRNGWAGSLQTQATMLLGGDRGCLINFEVRADLTEEDEIVSYILSHNLHRREMTTVQRARIALRAKGRFEAQARENMVATQNNDAGRAALSDMTNLVPVHSRDQAAALAKVSAGTMHNVELVDRNAIPELRAAMDSGRVKPATAAAATRLPPEDQREVAATGKLPKPAHCPSHESHGYPTGARCRSCGPNLCGDCSTRREAALVSLTTPAAAPTKTTPTTREAQSRLEGARRRADAHGEVFDEAAFLAIGAEVAEALGTATTCTECEREDDDLDDWGHCTECRTISFRGEVVAELHYEPDHAPRVVCRPGASIK